MQPTINTPTSQSTRSRGASLPLWPLRLSLLGLALSAVLMAVWAGTYLNISKASELRAGSGNLPLEVLDERVIVRTGEGHSTERGSFLITDLSKQGNELEGRALLTRRLQLEAAHFPFVNYQIKGRHAGQRVFLRWRTRQDPGILHHASLYWAGGDTTVFHLATNPDWRGTITEVGLDIYGELGDESLEILATTLLPANIGNYLACIWSEWTAFRGWSQRSINQLTMSSSKEILPLLPFVGFYVLQAMTISLAVSLVWLRHYALYGTYGLVFSALIPWIGLDLLWERELRTQLAATDRAFRGLQQTEKFLTLEDREVFEFVTRLKEFLPHPLAGRTRVILLHDSRGHDFIRLRAQFHLLPYNVYNFGKIPPIPGARKGDFVIVLGDSPAVTYNRESGTISWKPHFEVAVRPLHTEPAGALYELTSRVKKTRRPL